MAYEDRWYDHFYLLIPAAAIIRMVMTILMITEGAGNDHISQSERYPLVNLDVSICTCYAKEQDKLLSEKYFIPHFAAKSPFMNVSATRFVDEGKMAVTSDCEIDSVSRSLKIYYQTGKLDMGSTRQTIE
ncbi:hypothetical protein IM792_17410 [Mucilaginibacter sp. JRF]|uniref:hypothetical protein n=1 Tax=Mucilaginibacter sp. JRF TaxID=2780088 RepID=UPI0018807B3C|nr:hypothetical protein [Mucilaginibacter sp. JRF]MBE9586236.1 hypothetical protein [Mucilaginibacter sp. JRF]